MSTRTATPSSRTNGAGAITARSAKPGLVLVVVLLATFVINLDTTIVNVALPALSRELHATTSGLQWVVDASNLAFAGLILTGETVGDRYGRRRTLAAGLAVFVAGSGIAAFTGTTDSLILWRVVMGAAAAFVFPTTLSIISQTFPDRAARAKAVGAWGAATGVAVALGPIVGGDLLAHYWWGSIFVAMVPVAALAMLGALVLVPADRNPAANPLDLRGLTLSGFAVAAAAFVALAIVENRRADPIMRGYSALATGVHVLPVAVAIAVSSGLGTVIAVRIGNKIVVGAGLVLVGAGYGWIAAFQTPTTSYGLIVIQMILLGSGMGLSTAPATESILGVVRPEQAGIGSAVNDATRLVGGTLGVAILGSVYASLYRAKVNAAAVPQAARDAAKASCGASRIAASHLSTAAAHDLLAHANSGFLEGLHVGCAVAAAVCGLGALLVAAYLPTHPANLHTLDPADQEPGEGLIDELGITFPR